MFPESLVILWEHTSAYLLVTCFVSILAFIIAYQYTKNLNEKTSSACEKNTPVQPNYMESPAAENDENEENEERALKNTLDDDDGDVGDTKTEDTKIEDDPKDSKVRDEKGGGEGNSPVQDEESMQHGPEFYLTPEQIPDSLMKAKEKMILHQMESTMSEDQKILEKKIQREQLSEIFKLVEQQSDRYGIKSVADMEEQMKLYTN